MSLQSSRRRRAAAFTLIELLVVVAIIAVLIALLIPAIQRVRTAAARTATMNNLKEIALGTHAYHDAVKTLPFNGTGNAAANNNYSGSWCFQILPYVDQQALYAALANVPVTVPVFSSPARGCSGVSSSNNQLNTDGSPKNPVPVSEFGINTFLNEPFPITNPAAGGMSAPNLKVSITGIADGASNTLLYSLRYMRTVDYDEQKGNSIRNPGFIRVGGGPGTGCTINYFVRAGDDPKGTANNEYRQDSEDFPLEWWQNPPAALNVHRYGFVWWWPPGGPFPEGSLMCMADCSVHYFPYAIGPDGLRPFMLPNDGLVTASPD